MKLSNLTIIFNKVLRRCGIVEFDNDFSEIFIRYQNVKFGNTFQQDTCIHAFEIVKFDNNFQEGIHTE